MEVSLCSLDGGSGEEADHFIEEAVSGKGEEVAFWDVLELGTGEVAGVVGLGGFVSTV